MTINLFFFFKNTEINIQQKGILLFSCKIKIDAIFLSTQGNTMNKILVMSLGVVLTAASLSSYASTEVRSLTGRTVCGHVSVTGQDNLDSLTAALSKKADAAGDNYFYITSAGGKNKLHGSAVLLR
jgi:multiple stress resistance protein BhsA